MISDWQKEEIKKINLGEFWHWRNKNDRTKILRKEWLTICSIKKGVRIRTKNRSLDECGNDLKKRGIL